MDTCSEIPRFNIVVKEEEEDWDVDNIGKYYYSY
jgi:hypothetical protein